VRVARHRTILHADMDAFYASIEQRDQPELRGRPVIVGGTGGRGVVSAASYEARRSGVHSAMPTAEARRLCPDGVYLRGDMARYARESKRLFEIFRRYAPQVEGLSLDEAFLDLTGAERLLGPALQVGERLRREVREKTGLAVSVGIAPIKMVAKIASDCAKPDGLLEVGVSELRGFLDPLPVGRIWGVGPVARARLEGAGIRTIGDLARADGRELHRMLGNWGDHIARLARGIDLREVEPYREAVSISEENTFAGDVSSPEVLDAAILAHAEAVARRLRRSGYCARTVVLKLKLARRVGPGPRGYPLFTRRTTMDEPSDDGGVIAAEPPQRRCDPARALRSRSREAAPLSAEPRPRRDRRPLRPESGNAGGICRGEPRRALLPDQAGRRGLGGPSERRRIRDVPADGWAVPVPRRSRCRRALRE
jgi:DNA polymerase-4